MNLFYDEMLFMRITADGATQTLIHEWMKNIQTYYNARYRCFARILEATGMTGPFNLTYKGKPRSDTFICEYTQKAKKINVSVFLRFCNGCDPAQIWINGHDDGTYKVFSIKEGKIVPRD